MPPGAAPILMKMGSFGLTLDPATRLRSEAVFTWCFEPEEQFGPDVVTNPSLSPPALGEHAWQTVAPVRCPRSGSLPEATMETIYFSCAGLDIHKATVVACVRRSDAAGRTHESVRTFGTMTAGAKWRWTGPNNPLGIGIIPFYRWYGDTADDDSGFNQLQRGASPGG